MKRTNKGFTLLELVIATALAFVVVLVGSNLLINFGKFTSTTVRSETSLLGAAGGVFEDMINRIISANAVSINPELPLTTRPGTCAAGSCIQIRVDQLIPAGRGDPDRYTPGIFTDDIIHTFWRNGTTIQYQSINLRTGATTGPTTLGRDITNLTFVRDVNNINNITVTLNAQTSSGPVGAPTREDLVSVATMRASRGGA